MLGEVCMHRASSVIYSGAFKIHTVEKLWPPVYFVTQVTGESEGGIKPLLPSFPALRYKHLVIKER